ncbi:hypothetical protein AB6819_09610 [Carnobacterium maltaromaticum]|uniref:hypothetical protein n=1 Tax=Carnobacterium maltaromaticum TaxID=2751 RepID=UPI000704BF04|nr:hypothetical protein [Carnobacterium maltaromaticum]KRN72085.1 hypothetical protein IV76_GL003201 [Carnobacterium maltaromaticum]CRH18871.1 conserved hypothetical protein [Carnobacterium maltaromaticum]
MTKIDESKQYKFSEIIAMLDNRELPKGTIVTSEHYPNSYPLIVAESLYCGALHDKSGKSPELTSRLIIHSWTIKLPKEDKFYLKAPDCFTGFLFLKHNKNIQKYYTSDKYEDAFTQVKFTQKEIDSMPFDTKFFEKIKVEQSDE